MVLEFDILTDTQQYKIIKNLVFYDAILVVIIIYNAQGTFQSMHVPFLILTVEKFDNFS